MKKIIVDANNIAHRAKHVNGALDDGITFGFLNQILTLAKVLDCSNFIFCWDSRHSYRKVHYPEYKANRVKIDLTDEDFDAFRQFKDLRTKVLPELGFKNVFMQTGYEADDVLSFIVKKFPDDYTIVSSDEDMYQLLEWADIYSPTKKETLDAKWFNIKYGILPSQWPVIKAYAGCSTDNVKGIAGVGEKTAINYLNGQLKKGKKFEAIINGHDIYKTNLPLVTLPYTRGARPISLALQDEDLFEMPFIDTFTKLGFNSFLSDKKMDTWIERLNLIEGRG